HPMRDSLSLALQGVDQIERIIESTLEFARPTKPDRQRSDINSILEKAVAFVKPSFQKKNVNLLIATSNKLPNVLVDPLQIQQVFFIMKLEEVKKLHMDFQIH
ncbi:MAG: hypothetical protein ACKO96_39540, partial [Flammeovirgaceae bacterium]